MEQACHSLGNGPRVTCMTESGPSPPPALIKMHKQGRINARAKNNYRASDDGRPFCRIFRVLQKREVKSGIYGCLYGPDQRRLLKARFCLSFSLRFFFVSWEDLIFFFGESFSPAACKGPYGLSSFWLSMLETFVRETATECRMVKEGMRQLRDNGTRFSREDKR